MYPHPSLALSAGRRRTAACGAALPALADVNVYTTREPALIQPVIDTFKVRVGLGPLLEAMTPVLEPDDEQTPLHTLFDVILQRVPAPPRIGPGSFAR